MKFRAVFCGLLFANMPMFAQELVKDTIATRQLDEVVVSDSRFALKRENSGKTVISITAEEIDQNQGKTVAELLNTKAGLELNGSRSFTGQNLGFYARGGNNRQVLVIIDGIQVSDPSSVSAEFDLRLLNLSQIGSIEVVKGAASTLYGNAAATAVINITSKQPKNDITSVQLQSSVGTNQSQVNARYNANDFSNTVTVNHKKKALTLSASIGNQNTNGLSAAIGEESDEVNRVNVNLRAGYEFSKDLKTNVAFYYDELNTDFDNGFPIEDADFSSKSEQLRFVLNSAYDYANGSINLNAAFNKVDRSFKSDFPSEFDAETYTVDVFNKYIFKEQFFTIVGINLIEHKTNFTEVASSTTVDPYVNAVYVSDFGLNLNTGARLNHHSEYGTNWVYNLNPSYNIRLAQGYLKFMGSYATSFIAPNLSQLYGPFGPNPELEPETNTTFEAGFEIRPNKNLRFSTLYFDRNEENGIDYVITDFDTFEGQYQNVVPTTNTYGFEMELNAKLNNHLNLSANYAFTEKGEGLALRIPKNKWNLGLQHQINKKWLAAASYQYVSSRDDLDFETFENVRLKAFDLLGLCSKYAFNDKISIFLNIENVFNTNYVELVDFTTRGRNVRMGLNVKIQ
ncbi:MAG: TonB-dependent receptor [Croceitalea sp.]|nr:TonB-dependent receptor [Croceitalea sp.]NNL07687.1 TonB-dependent receptor [Croceitalea sp.]